MRARTGIPQQSQHVSAPGIDERVADAWDEGSEFGARLRHGHPRWGRGRAEGKRPAVDDLVARGVEDLDGVAFGEECVRAGAGGDGGWGHG
jgi:hypothetical protein